MLTPKELAFSVIAYFAANQKPDDAALVLRVLNSPYGVSPEEFRKAKDILTAVLAEAIDPPDPLGGALP
jgi:hypothetical protein